MALYGDGNQFVGWATNTGQNTLAHHGPCDHFLPRPYRQYPGKVDMSLKVCKSGKRIVAQTLAAPITSHCVAAGGRGSVTVMVSNSGKLVVMSNDECVWSSAPVDPDEAKEIASSAGQGGQPGGQSYGQGAQSGGQSYGQGGQPGGQSYGQGGQSADQSAY